MLINTVKVYPSKVKLPKKKQLAWKIAEIASDNAKLNNDAIEMSINRIIDNASVAIASLNRKPVISARDMAKAHLRNNGSTLFGVSSKIKFDAEWAAWAIEVNTRRRPTGSGGPTMAAHFDLPYSASALDGNSTSV